MYVVRRCQEATFIIQESRPDTHLGSRRHSQLSLDGLGLHLLFASTHFLSVLRFCKGGFVDGDRNKVAFSDVYGGYVGLV